jgi:chaperone modulatory protein CbpM
MTFDMHEFLLRAELDEAMLQIWIEEGWIIPSSGDQSFADADLARARLIRDLTDDLGVNAEGVGVILNLIDQVHGLRGALRELVEAARHRPPS